MADNPRNASWASPDDKHSVAVLATDHGTGVWVVSPRGSVSLQVDTVGFPAVEIWGPGQGRNHLPLAVTVDGVQLPCEDYTDAASYRFLDWDLLYEMAQAYCAQKGVTMKALHDRRVKLREEYVRAKKAAQDAGVDVG